MKKTVLLLSIISSSLLVGCASTSTEHYEYSAMADELKVGDMRVKLKGDLMLFSTSVINKKSNDVSFQYKFKFYDQDGFEVQPEARPWRRKNLSAKESTTLQGVGPDASVVSSKVHIKK